jgi:hypothetical protein
MQATEDTMDHEMQALHLAALQRGTARVACRVGDAEGRLWSAPRSRVMRRTVRSGALRNEIHLLLDDAGLPLAWWQRSSGAPVASVPWSVPYAVPHLTLHVIDGVPHGLGVEALIDELAQAVGLSALGYRRTLKPNATGCKPNRIQPAAAGVLLDAGTVAPTPGAGSSHPLSVC